MTKIANNAWQSIQSLLTNKYVGLGLLFIAALVASVYFLLDRIVMPSYVRHEAHVTVPDVKTLNIEEARLQLEQMDLQVEVESNRYNPQIPRDIVVDQNPKAYFQVKPGRRIYLTINTGATPESTVPSLVGISLKEALNRLNAAGLRAEESDIRPDSIPHPYANMVTKQSPEAGNIVEEGSRVMLWYSTGLGSEFVTVPDLVGQKAHTAQQTLLQRKLRSVVLGGNEASDLSQLTIVRQSHPEGTRIKEGSEIRLFVDTDDETN